jgi:putative membrane protein
MPAAALRKIARHPAMLASALFAFLHFVSVFGIFATVFVEWQTLGPAPTCAEARRIQRCDRWFGIFASAVLIVGFLRVYYFEKGKAFYFSSPFFMAKMTLFLLVGLLSIYPTLRFVKWRADTREGRAPTLGAGEYGRLLALLRAEVLLLLAVALCASLMARGVGL